MAQEYLDAQENLRRLGSAATPAAPAAVTEPGFFERILGSSKPAPNTMPDEVLKALEKYKK